MNRHQMEEGGLGKVQRRPAEPYLEGLTKRHLDNEGGVESIQRHNWQFSDKVCTKQEEKKLLSAKVDDGTLLEQ